VGLLLLLIAAVVVMLVLGWEVEGADECSGVPPRHLRGGVVVVLGLRLFEGGD